MLRTLKTIGVVDALLLDPVARTIFLPVLVAFEAAGLVSKHFSDHVHKFWQDSNSAELGNVSELLRARSIHESTSLYAVMVHIDKR